MSQRETSLDELVGGLRRAGRPPVFLALGQTALWDEPVKASLVRALAAQFRDARFVAGVHDTDYFAKLAGHPVSVSSEPYVAVAHNDASTRGLWSAAGEMHVLFGSEAVPDRSSLSKEGGVDLVRGGSFADEPESWLDGVTEAWGWSGLIRTGWRREVVADVKLARILPALRDQWRSTVEASAAMLGGGGDRELPAMVERWMVEFADNNPSANLPDFYEELLRRFHGLLNPGLPPVETTRTSVLLRFNRSTALLPRFAVVAPFVEPSRRAAAGRAYDASVAGSDIYPLERFGEGALPFDVLVPGRGRGTLRILADRVRIEAPDPIELPGSISNLADLAALLEDAFGPDCVLLGKAVSLLPMLGAEFHFVFHEGASGYSHRSAKLVDGLRAAGFDLPAMLPIVRLRLRTWDSLSVVTGIEFRVPPFLRQALGRPALAADDWAACWRRAVEWETQRLREFAVLRSPRAVVAHLARTVGGHWTELLSRHEIATKTLLECRDRAAVLKARIAALRDGIAADRRRVEALELAKGQDFRERGGVLDASAVQERSVRFDQPIAGLRHQVAARQEELRSARLEKASLERSVEAVEARNTLRRIESEAERERTAQVADALRTVHGIPLAGRRPSAWWFPLVSPDGAWFDQVASTQTGWCEPLGGRGA